MKYIITLLLASIGLLVSAQVKRTIYQTFELVDENSQVTLDVYDEFEIEEWSSNHIMIVTTVILESGAQHLLDIYVKQGRYDIEALDEEQTKKLVSKSKVRLGMKYKGKGVYEIVKVKMYIPENYELKGSNRLVKKEEETASKNQ